MKIVNQENIKVELQSSEAYAIVGLRSKSQAVETLPLKDTYTAHMEKGDLLFIIEGGSDLIVAKFDQPTPEEGMVLDPALLAGDRYLISTVKGNNPDFVYFNHAGELVGQRVANTPKVVDGYIRNLGFTVTFDESSVFTAHFIDGGDTYGVLYEIETGDMSRVRIPTSRIIEIDKLSLSSMTDSNFGSMVLRDGKTIDYLSTDGSFRKRYHLSEEFHYALKEAVNHVLQDISLRTETDRLKRIMKNATFKETDLHKLLIDIGLPMLSVFALLSRAQYRNKTEIALKVKPHMFSNAVLPKERADMLVETLANKFSWSKTHVRDAYRVLRRLKLQSIPKE